MGTYCPSTKVFSQLATKLLDMVSVFYFPCFYCSAHKFNLLFYSVEVKKRLREWRFLSYKASCSQNVLRYIDSHDDTDDRSIHFLEMNAACKHKHEIFKWQSFIHKKYLIFCYVPMGWERGRTTKTKKEIVFQPNGNTVEPLMTDTPRDKYKCPSYRGVRLMGCPS